MRFQVGLSALLMLCTSVAFAELPSPRLDRVAPLGGMAGSSVELEIQGADLEEPQLIFDHPGISAAAIEGKERWFKVQVAADVPEGTYDCRVSGKYGVSSPRLFAVAHGIADVPEKEPNNTAAEAQEVTLNQAIAGSSDGNDQDVYRLHLGAGQRVTIDCQAARLDSMLDASLTVLNSSGAAVASRGDYFGRDPFIDFVAPAEGDYRIVINDLSFRGGLPYRLVISDRPHVENVFPRAIQVDQATDLIISGRNLGPDSAVSERMLFDQPLSQRSQAFTAAADVLGLRAYRFLEHPTQHSVMPTAATCTLTGMQFRPDCGGRAALNAVTLMASETPVTLEVEPNDQAAPQALTLPAVVSGRFDAPREADWYEFTVAENGSYSVDVFCERIAGGADPYVVLVDDQGKRLQELDDFGHRVNAFDGHLRDPSGTVNLSAGKKYRAMVQDRYQRGGARYQYVLAIRLAQPDFYVAAIHSQNPGPGGCTVWRGGAAYFDIVVHQQGGYNGPVTLTAENLPPGVHAAATTLGLGNNGTFVLWADADAPLATAVIKLVATGQRGDERFIREVRPYTRVWNQGDGTSRPVREAVIAVRDTAPYSLAFAEPKLTVVAGQKVEAKLKLQRLWPKFQEPLNVIALSWPGNFKLTSSQFAGSATEVTLAIEVQAGTRPGEYTLAVLGQGQVPFTKNADGSDAKNTLVSLPSQPITLVVTAP